MPANDDVGDYSQPADADSWSVHVVEVANDDGLLEPRKKNNRLAVPIFLTESDIENLNVSIFDYLTEADAKAALTSSVNARFTTFVNAAVNHWENVIEPADQPGMGSGAYAAAQAVLNQDIAAIETYRISKGW